MSFQTQWRTAGQIQDLFWLKNDVRLPLNKKQRQQNPSYLTYFFFNPITRNKVGFFLAWPFPIWSPVGCHILSEGCLWMLGGSVCFWTCRLSLQVLLCSCMILNACVYRLHPCLMSLAEEGEMDVKYLSQGYTEWHRQGSSCHDDNNYKSMIW